MINTEHLILFEASLIFSDLTCWYCHTNW